MNYDRWPLWVRILWRCTFPFSEALATILLGLVLMLACVVLLPFEMGRKRK